MGTNQKRSIVAMVIFLFALYPATTVWGKTGDWGLGFQKPGEKPTGNESMEYLKPYDAYFIGSSDEKVIYLTFDSGYENGYTEPILDVLKKNEVPATFFLVGSYIKQHPDLVNRMVQDGHIVGNHTMKHPDMTKLTDKATFEEQLTQVEDVYQSVTGKPMKKLYRPPQGKYSESNLRMTKELGYKTIFWSLAYKDYDDKNQPSREEAFAKLVPRIHPGAVVLLHNTSKANAEILDELIQRYRELGYSFGSLDSLA